MKPKNWKYTFLENDTEAYLLPFRWADLVWYTARAGTCEALCSRKVLSGQHKLDLSIKNISQLQEALSK